MAASIWKGSISFGLLNIPVTLQSAQSEKEIHFSLLDKKDLSRIKYLKVSAKTGQEVPGDRIVKGYEYQSGRYVVLTEAELKKANIKATQTIDVEDFVLLEEVDPMFFDRPYYLAPQKGTEKGYFLLRDALEEAKKVAVAKLVIRIKMAEDLVDGMTSKWNPDQFELDLDPGDGVLWDDVISAALLIKKDLELLGLRIFVDYFCNSKGSTSVLPYSLRALEKSSVAWPVAWSRLGSYPGGDSVTLKKALQLLKKERDPWANYFARAPVLPLKKN